MGFDDWLVEDPPGSWTPLSYLPRGSLRDHPCWPPWRQARRGWADTGPGFVLVRVVVCDAGSLLGPGSVL